ncbi:MAG: glycosyltransferase family 2 protein [Chloroflexi bacterium]|nr:glycosyltransferase family 2 protein [Chloroflexota bacterium]
MWRSSRVSVIFPTYNERDSIYDAICEFLATGYVDEVVVIDNNAAPGTADEVRRTPATLVHEPKQGYGNAIRRGFKEATGDLLIVAEPDGTFRGHDVVKLLAYSDDCDVVYGSRTHREFIWHGANMGFFLRWGNYAVAKLMEFLFNSTTLSDVGCTMRLIKRSALQQIELDFRVGGSFFGPEMMLLSLMSGQSMVQVPVNYTRRVGESSVTGDPVKAVRLGLRMIALILEYRLRSLVNRRQFRSYGAAQTTRRYSKP